MIVGFFLPLFNPGLPDFDEAIAAFTLPLSGGKLAAAMVQAGVYADQPLVTGIHGNPDSALTLFALYLVPVLALYGIVDELRCAGKGKSHWWLRILAMLSPALALGAIYVVFREQLSAFAIPNINTSDTIAALGPGAWTLGGGWLFALLGIVIAPKVKKPKTPELPERKTPATKALPGKPKLPAPRKPE